MVKQEGGANDLIERLQADEAFAAVDYRGLLDPAGFVGRAPEQVDEFIAEMIEPIRAMYPEDLGGRAEVSV